MSGVRIAKTVCHLAQHHVQLRCHIQDLHAQTNAFRRWQERLLRTRGSCRRANATSCEQESARSDKRRLKARSWGASKCAIRHLGPTMTASEVVPFTLEFLFFCAGNFILAQNSCWGPRIFPPLSLLVIHTLSLAQCPELIVVSHRQGKPRRETSNPT